MERNSPHTASSIRIALFLAVILCGAWTPCVCALDEAARAEAAEIWERVFPLTKRSKEADRAALSPEQRQLLITYLKERIARMREGQYSEINLNSSSEAFDLDLLDDGEGRGMVMKEYLRDPNFGSQTLRFLNDPKTIAFVGEKLFADEPLQYYEGDVGLIGAQEVARRDILHLLRSTNVFDPEVRFWARRMDERNVIDPPGTEIMRTWFRDNQAALKAADFKAVKPGTVPLPRAVKSDSSRADEVAREAVLEVESRRRTAIAAIALVLIAGAISAFLFWKTGKRPGNSA